MEVISQGILKDGKLNSFQPRTLRIRYHNTQLSRYYRVVVSRSKWLPPLRMVLTPTGRECSPSMLSAPVASSTPTLERTPTRCVEPLHPISFCSGRFCFMLPALLCACRFVVQFGVEIKLSQFTLTKLVVVTPYYLLVNETDVRGT